jgi:hypothetical protein
MPLSGCPASQVASAVEPAVSLCPLLACCGPAWTGINGQAGCPGPQVGQASQPEQMKLCWFLLDRKGDWFVQCFFV